jgi:putative phosphoribosyl transferase
MKLYYKDRAGAGKQLAKQLEKYKNTNVVVLALSEGAALVAAQVAMHIHANMLLYLVRGIYLPGEHEALAGLSSTGTFSYNRMFSAGQLEEMTHEYMSYIEQERLARRHELNVLLGHDGEIKPDFLRHHVVILVADGLSSGLSLDVAADYLKTIAVKKLVVATPLASVSAVDHMHLVSDEIACLAVAENFMDTNHYYEDNTIPSVDDVLKIMRNISINWERK